jgi:hypothetical protein
VCSDENWLTGEMGLDFRGKKGIWNKGVDNFLVRACLSRVVEKTNFSSYHIFGIQESL